MAAALITMAGILLLSLVLLSGRGAWLIAGYNTMSREEKARYDEKTLCRRTGILLLVLDACIGLMILGEAQNLPWLSWLSGCLLAVCLIGGMVWINRTPGSGK